MKTKYIKRKEKDLNLLQKTKSKLIIDYENGIFFNQYNNESKLKN
jgi:hypothetical protein